MVLFMLWRREEGKRGSFIWDHLPKNPQSSTKDSRIHYIDGRSHLREVSWTETAAVGSFVGNRSNVGRMERLMWRLH